MNDSRRREFLKVAGGVAVVGSLAGCAGEAQEDDNGNETEDEEEEPENETEEQPPEEDEQEEPQEEEPEATGDDLLRLAHMVPDFPAVDVYVDDSEEPVISDLGYTETTDYIELPAGEAEIRVTAAGAQSLVVFNEQVSIPAGNTTAVALGTPDSEDEAGSTSGLQIELFGDQNTPPEESINNSRLRLIHASPDAPAVDVLVGQTTVFEGISFGEAEYFDLPAGDYDFDIFPADGEPIEDPGTGNESDGGNESESDDGSIFSGLTADGGSEVSLLQDDENETEEDGENETVPEEDEEEAETSTEPVYSFDATTEANGVYTAFATGYLDPEAASSESEFEAVITQDVVDGEVPEAEGVGGEDDE